MALALPEDITRFSYSNVAESLQHIPGVTISRTGSEGHRVLVRGTYLGITRINGMEVRVTSRYPDQLGGATLARQMDFNVFNSNLFQSLVLHKSSPINGAESTVDGVLDIQTLRPFDLGDSMVLHGGLDYSDAAEELDPQAVFLFSKTFADEMVGFLMGVSVDGRTVLDEGSSSFDWQSAGPFGAFQGGPVPPEVASAFVPRIPGYDSFYSEVDRTGLLTSLQIKPTERTELTLDIFHTKHEVMSDERNINAPLNNIGSNIMMNINDYEVDSENSIVYFDVQNAGLLSGLSRKQFATEFSQLNIAIDHAFTDVFRINGLFGKARSEFKDIQNTRIELRKTGVDISYDFRNGRLPLLNYQGADNPSDWSVNAVRLRPSVVENEFEVANIGIEFDLNDWMMLVAGVQSKSDIFNTRSFRRPIEDNAGIAGVIPDSYLMAYSSGSLGIWQSPDFGAINAASGIGSLMVNQSLADSYGLKEETLTLYSYLYMDFDMGAATFRGDVGIKRPDVDRESRDHWPDGLAFHSLTVEHSYSDILPFLNLSIRFPQSMRLYFNYVTSQERPSIESTRANLALTVTGGMRSVSANNLRLDPISAALIETGFDWRFSEGALLGVSWFRKEYDHSVQMLSQVMPYTETGLPLEPVIATCNNSASGYGEFCNENLVWNVTLPRHAQGYEIEGYEINYQHPFSSLPGIWANFGFMASIGNIKGSIPYVDASGQIIARDDISGLSRSSHALTLYYDDGSFSTRLSAVYRDGYFTQHPGPIGNDKAGVHDSTFVDFSMAFRLNNRIKLMLDVLNLTNEADDQWIDQAADRTDYFHRTGQRVHGSLQYTFGL